MRLPTVSIVLALAACVEPAAGPPIRTLPRPRVGLAVTADALALLEASPTLDGYPVGPAPGAATIVVTFASWCGHCKDELHAIDQIRGAHRGLRVIGVNYRPHEEYDGLGDAVRVRAYLAQHAPWLIVVPADDALFAALGQPPKIPTLYVYDTRGVLVRIYDRRVDPLPTARELDALIAQLGV